MDAESEHELPPSLTTARLKRPSEGKSGPRLGETEVGVTSKDLHSLQDETEWSLEGIREQHKHWCSLIELASRQDGAHDILREHLAKTKEHYAQVIQSFWCEHPMGRLYVELSALKRWYRALNIFGIHSIAIWVKDRYTDEDRWRPGQHVRASEVSPNPRR